MRHHEAQRSSLTLQLLVLTVTLIGTYVAVNVKVIQPVDLIRFGIGLAVVALGVLGFLLVIKTRQTTQQHTKRARLARRALGYLEPFNKPNAFPKLHYYYAAFYVFIIVVGIGLAARGGEDGQAGISKFGNA